MPQFHIDYFPVCLHPGLSLKSKAQHKHVFLLVTLYRSTLQREVFVS